MPLLWKRPVAFCILRQRKRPPLLLLSFATSSSPSPLQRKWQVGDFVWVDKHANTNNAKNQSNQNNENITRMWQGIVQEYRGNGWYRVKRESDKAVVSCRSSMMQHNNKLMKPHNGKTLPDIQVRSFSREVDQSRQLSKNEKKEEYPVIVDMDAALQTYKSMLTSEEAHNHLNNTETIDDVSLLHRAAYHATYNNWIALTDLHCAPSTIKTCLQVLERVHTCAQERQAGVLFLGDFWHHRGVLRVDCLNAVLDALKQWTVPLVMIPGNHDQVTLQGHEHSLTPLERAFSLPVDEKRWNQTGLSSLLGKARPSTVSGPLIWTHPTVWNGALFLPHIRDTTRMEAMLQSDYCKKKRNKVPAIFCHADVTGAYMNDGIRSNGGIAPSLWPPETPIYSGHFHKPHVVSFPGKTTGDTICIEYLGSPYQVSLAEAEQNKSLVVFSRNTKLDTTMPSWSVLERIPIQLGRKHFKRSAHAFLALFAQTHHSEDEVETLSSRAGFSPNDRLVVMVDPLHVDSEAMARVEELSKQLRQEGVHVEIRQVVDRTEVSAWPLRADSHQENREGFSIQSTWEHYWEEQVQRNQCSEKDAEQWTEVGLNFLSNHIGADVKGVTTAELDSSKTTMTGASTTKLKFESVTLEGYGPFRDTVTYPLANRGLVLLRGQNKGDSSNNSHDQDSLLSPDESSNGSGKSSLAMATLWALTGSTDPKPVAHTRSSSAPHIRNEQSPLARVTVRGHKVVFDHDNAKDSPSTGTTTHRSLPFEVTRTRTKSRKNGLSFVLDGRDESRQSPAETQQAMLELLELQPPEILGRTIFHGQFGIHGLLEAPDAKLKEDLSLVLVSPPLSVWQDAAKEARREQKEVEQRVHALKGMISLREDDLADLERKEENHQSNLREAERQLHEFQQELQMKDDENCEGETPSAVVYGEKDLESELEDIETKMLSLDRTRNLIIVERDEQLGVLEADLEEQILARDTVASSLQKCHLQVCTLELQYSVAQEEVDRLVELWGTSGESNHLDECPTCGQSLGEPLGHQLASSATVELRKARESLGRKEETLQSANLECAKLKDELVVATSLAEQAATMLHGTRDEWDRRLTSIDEKLQIARTQKDSIVGQQLANIETELKGAASQEKHKAEQKEKQQAIEYCRKALASSQEQRKDCSLALERLRSEKDTKEKTSKQMKGLTDSFGPRGVQNFVFRNTLGLLQCISQSYLNDLSDNSQKLELAIDENDRVSRNVLVKNALDGSFNLRPLSALSGGQWRRCALSLQLGFADLVARHGLVRSSLLVMDEPLTHLDRAGRNRVGSVLRRVLDRRTNPYHLQASTVMLILQDLASEELEESFDAIDLVQMTNGQSTVHVDGETC